MQKTKKNQENLDMRIQDLRVSPNVPNSIAAAFLFYVDEPVGCMPAIHSL